MLFVYEAVGKSGRKTTGKAHAGSIDELRRDLALVGLSLVDARQDLLGSLTGSLKPRQLSRAVMIDMFGYLRGLLAMGIDMLAAWDAVADAVPNTLARETTSRIKTAIHQGHSLHRAMENTGVFPPMVLGNVQAGEVSGTLENVFQELEDHYRRESELVQHLLKATMYPLISLVFLFGISVILLAVVVPQIKPIFPDNPPLISQMVLYLSDSVVGYWWTVPVFVIGLIVVWIRMPVDWKAKIWEVIFRFPVIGSALKNVVLSNLFNNLALMLGAGVSLSVALETAKNTLSSVAVKQRMQRVIQLVHQGGKLSEGFRDPFFPPVTAGIVLQGEMTGHTDEYFKRLSTFLRERAQARLTTVGTLLEPLILLLAGSMLMFIAGGIFLAIYGALGAFRT